MRAKPRASCSVERAQKSRGAEKNPWEAGISCCKHSRDMRANRAENAVLVNKVPLHTSHHLVDLHATSR